MSQHAGQSRRIVAAIFIITGSFLGALYFVATARTADAKAPPSMPVPAAPRAPLVPFVPAVTAPLQPVELDIPSIGAAIPVIDVGLTPTGNMDVPDNYTQAGWYEYGALPGKQGSAVIDAHVDSGGYRPTTNGVFKKLDKVASGDLIQVRMSDGSLAVYQATDSVAYRTTAFPSDQVFQQQTGGNAYLKLITCHGTWQPSMRTYDQRLVVVAKLLYIAVPHS